ncbi:hypothetical protein N9333_01115 [Gammaproteobacteria bacterium]|nr:hypothetical protein [Gammaproteobacteria bacterium]
MSKHFLSILVFSICMNTHASEKEISSRWCDEYKGIAEFRTINATYVDCLTSEYAVEVEFDYKWKESIGQSLHYAQATGKKPAIVFVRRHKSRVDYYTQLIDTITHHNLNIRIFFIEQ